MVKEKQVMSGYLIDIDDEAYRQTIKSENESELVVQLLVNTSYWDITIRKVQLNCGLRKLTLALEEAKVWFDEKFSEQGKILKLF